MLILSKISEIKTQIAQWKKEGKSISFVPTMGALHAGHESLIKRAKQESDKLVVSIFVNPTQFGPNEDYDCYPRTLEEDKVVCKRQGVDIIFAPTAIEMYPDKDLTTITPPSSYTDKLCGKSRIGHFNGVALVVTKLFNIVQPDKAFFGQKDAQQLIIIKKVCSDLNCPVEIIGCPTVREEDGLAMSSRNQYLSKQGRLKANSLFKVLKKIEELYNNNKCETAEVFEIALKELNEGIKIEYLEAYDALTLEKKSKISSNTLIAIAGKISEIRLIDNIIIR